MAAVHQVSIIHELIPPVRYFNINKRENLQLSQRNGDKLEK